MINNSIRGYLPLSLIQFFRKCYTFTVKIQCFIARGIKTHTYEGFPLKIYIFDPVSKNWYDHDWKRDEIKFLKKGKLKKGARVFDIGAHHGIVALIFSKIVGKKGEVVAVEMDKMHIAIARINRNNNKAANLKLVNAAVSEKNQDVYFKNDQVVIPKIAPKKNKESIPFKISSISIDDLTNKYGVPDILYMDIEGYEVNALRGAQKTLGYYPDCCIEVHVKNGLENFNGSVEEVISYFPFNKYNLYIAPAQHSCTFRVFNHKSKIIKDRFYLIALNKNN